MIKVHKGFSLIELSIVLIIIGVLVSISLSVGGGQANVDNIKSTQNTLDKIDRALASYLKVNNALPCPADGTAPINNIGIAGALTNPLNNVNITNVTSNPQIVTTSTAHNLVTGDQVYISNIVGTGSIYINNKYYTVGTTPSSTKFELANVNYQNVFIYSSGGTVGFNMSNATCAAAVGTTPGYNITGGASNYYVGIIPTRALGLSDDYALDAWGHRITYAVSKQCIDPDNWVGTYATKCTTQLGADGGNITINDLSGATSGAAKISNAAYVIMSLGKNGYGAWNRAGSRISSTLSSKEANNSSATYPSPLTFNDGFINDGTPGSSSYFDDILHWRTSASVWDNAYSGGVLPPCNAGQIVVANGGGSYGCAYNNFKGIKYNVSPNSAVVTSGNGLPTLAINLTNYPLAKLAIITGACSTKNNAASSTGYYFIYKDGTNSSTASACYLATSTGVGDRLDIVKATAVPIPDNAVTLQITANANPASTGIISITVDLYY